MPAPALCLMEMSQIRSPPLKRELSFCLDTEQEFSSCRFEEGQFAPDKELTLEEQLKNTQLLQGTPVYSEKREAQRGFWLCRGCAVSVKTACSSPVLGMRLSPADCIYKVNVKTYLLAQVRVYKCEVVQCQ